MERRSGNTLIIIIITGTEYSMYSFDRGLTTKLSGFHNDNAENVALTPCLLLLLRTTKQSFFLFLLLFSEDERN